MESYLGVTKVLARCRRALLVSGHLLLLSVVIIGCGSDDTAPPPASSSGAADSELEVFPVLLPERVISFDDFVSAGWKKSREYDVDTVPGATEIWYGFFDQKDIEIRFYASHDAALGQGRESAESAIDRKLRQGGQVGASNRGAGSTGVTKYGAYVVAGNTVMLCELDVKTCTDLVDAIGGS
jgi:hypothetical protein